MNFLFVRTRQHGNADFFIYILQRSRHLHFAKTCYLVLSIHIAENAMTMIMTTVLLCIKDFLGSLA